MSGAGFGAGGWGTVPWGGADQLLAEDACDLFLFDETNMDSILTALFVEGVGDPTQFELDYPSPPGTSDDLGILSGDTGDVGFATGNAYLSATAAVDSDYTVEVNFTFEALPNDFNSVPERHVMFGVSDATGPCAAVFISQVGLAYAGAVHHIPAAPDPNGVLVLDSSLQVIPGTAPYAPIGVPMTFRLAVSSAVGAVYLFATPTADLTSTGHQLVAILPVIDAGDLTFPPIERAVISVRGTTPQPSRVALDRWCLSSFFDVPNVVPVANAGQDQATRACAIALLDGSSSFDPEGSPLTYQWRVIDAPLPSSFASEGYDGITYPVAPFTGFTSRFHSAALAALEPSEPILYGDVVVINGVARTVIGKATDVNGFHVQVVSPTIPDNLNGVPFKLVRQRGLSAPTSAITSFFADVPGFYKFDLVVFDGSLYSLPSTVILNVLESVLPRGCTPNMDFIFDYVGDFWRLVENAGALGTVWSGLAQVAATELYTLWQHEYSKSLRDVQRTLTRRWLHYDLLLAEPLPELTKIRAIYSGVQSTNIATPGDPGVVGTSLVLTSPALDAPAVLDWVFATTAQAAAVELRSRLLEVDTRFSVAVIPSRDGTFLVLRIDAPFPFTVDDSTTTPIFVGDDSSGTLEGLGAASGGVKTYVVDRSLAGLGIREDDMLVLAGVGYRIVRVTSGTSVDPDSFSQQRVVLKDSLPVPAPTSWKIVSTVKSELLNFWEGLVSNHDNVCFEVTDANGGDPDLIETTALGVAQGLPGYLGFDATPLGAALSDVDKTVYLAKCVRRTYLPVSPLLKDLPALQEHIVIEDDEATLRRNVDYFLEEYRGAPAIRFLSGSSLDVWEGAIPPDRLWAEYSFMDNSSVIEANFGEPAGLTLDDLAGLPGNVDYLSAVRGLWYAFFNGPRPDNIRIGAQIFLALPFAEEAGVIEEIRSDFSPTTGRILVRDSASTEIVRAYTYPAALSLENNPETGELYVVGDSVSQFAPLVAGVEIFDYVKDPTWFAGTAQQGVFAEVQKYHTFSIRVNSAVFDLSALLLVRSFVLTLRPTYTYPAIIVDLSVGDTDLSIIDLVQARGTMLLNDTPCQSLGSTMFDDARSSGEGSWWNQFDNNEDTPAPMYPTPDAGVTWAYDKGFLCPSDSLVANLTYEQVAPGPALFDTFLVFDDTLKQAITFLEVGPVVVPASPSELSIPVTGSGLAIFDGALYTLRLLVVGGPGAFATDYELVVEVNGVDAVVQAFDASDPVFEVNATITGAVLLGDTITYKIRVPAASPAPGARSPDWLTIAGLVIVEDGLWSFGDTVPAGTYFASISL
jgi:hypothetical protein